MTDICTIYPDGGQTDSITTLNDSALANLKFNATKVNQDQELPGSNKDEIQKTITDGFKNKPFLVFEEEV